MRCSINSASDIETLRSALNRYRSAWIENPEHLHAPGRDHQRETLPLFLELLTEPDSASRSHFPGHLTGSALITHAESNRVLLTLHGKLNRWIQTGGHADGDFDLAAVALREGREESGLKDLQFTSSSREPEIFDLDVHTIPAFGDTPEHCHFDVRYLLKTASPDSIKISDESRDLRWFSIAEACRVAPEASMIRQFQKLAYLYSCAAVKKE